MAKKEASALNVALGKFITSMGEGVIHTAAELPPCKKIASSVPVYNYITSGGFPVGRVIEHVGENGSLKSYMAYDAIARFQRYDWANDKEEAFRKFHYEGTGATRELVKIDLAKGYKPKLEPEARRVALVDLEATYTPDWGDNFGIDNEGLILIRPTLLTEVADIVQTLLAEESISLVVIDSLSAVGTDDEVENSMESNQMASGARFWNKAFRKFQAAMNSNGTKESTLLVINSLYTTVGIAYGDPEKLRNGEQLKRTKSLSVKFKALKEISAKTDHGEDVVGRNITIKCLKDKTASLGKSANFFYAFKDYGSTKAGKTDVGTQVVDLGLRLGIVERKGAWYQYKDTRVQGMDSFVNTLIEVGKIKEIKEEIKTLTTRTYEKEDGE
jgi:recombination protein RecA